WAIGVVVLICVALTIGVGLVLTRRAVETATLRDLSAQVDGVAGAAKKATSPRVELHLLQQQGYFRRQDEKELFDKQAILPAGARKLLAQGLPVRGTVNYGGNSYYFAAQSVNPGTLIVLRPRGSLASLSPYVWGLFIAAAAGGLLAALAAFLLARRIAQPV